MNRTTARVAASAGVFVLFALLGFSAWGPPAGADIDPSWTATVALAAAQGAQWGSDIAFTYGPLGFLSQYQAQVVEHSPVAWPGRLALAALLALLVAAVAARATALQWIAGGLLVIAFGSLWAGDVSWIVAYPLGALAIAWEARQEASRLTSRLSCLVIAWLLTTLWFVKFSLFPLWLVWIVCMTLALLAMRDWMRIAMIGIGTVAAGATVVVTVEQRPDSIVSYVVASLDVASGYAFAMQRPPVAWTTDALAVVAVLACSAAWTLRAAADRFSVATTCVGLVAVAALGLAYKAGLTRVDEIHLLHFVPVCLALALAVVPAGPWNNVAALQAALAAGALAAALALVATSVEVRAQTRQQLTTGAQTAARLAQNLAELGVIERRGMARVADNPNAAPDLEAIRARVGSAPIDILTVHQGVVLANGMTLRPRPVFQSYSAYTAGLLERNAAFLRSERAPPWVLLNLRAVDGRYPGSEDASAWLEIASAYEPVDTEAGYLLFGRRKNERSFVVTASAESQARLGDWLELPACPPACVQRLSVRTSMGRTGVIASTLGRAPRLFIEFVDDSGQGARFRIVPEVLASGIVVRPLILTAADVAALARGGEGIAPRRARLVADGGAARFDSAIQIRIDELVLTPDAQ